MICKLSSYKFIIAYYRKKEYPKQLPDFIFFGTILQKIPEIIRQDSAIDVLHKNT